MVEKSVLTSWITDITNSLKSSFQKETMRSSKSLFDRRKACEALLTSESLFWSAGSETPRTDRLGPWTAFATTSVLCEHVFLHLCVCVRAIEVDSVFSPWCFLVLGQCQSSVTGDKARLLPRQEEMELGSLERTTHKCIYIILEGSSAMLNSCAVISELSCLHRESCGLFRELSL